jgi:histidyl-tRNA synthetase
MAKKNKVIRPKARLPRGLRDVRSDEVRSMEHMLSQIRQVYDSYGFEPLETSAFEYSDALGKFLPDDDRPNEGVFSFLDEDEQWLSLRYDLTAPLARFVAENYDGLPKPFRRYQTGSVWRNEKPGPGRYRQFTQFDADTVGAPAPAADAEIAMMAADCLERLGINRGQYIIRVNNRKILDGVLERIGIIGHEPEVELKRVTVLRAIDKLDRLGPDGVRLLLGAGRKDVTGDFTKGAGLEAAAIERIMAFTQTTAKDRLSVLSNLKDLVGDSEIGAEGIAELGGMHELLSAAGFEDDRVVFDSSVVRGLGYYTGPVMEAELTFEAQGEEGGVERFGSVGGGGRYDGLVKRFKGIEVPATGFSIGVSRLYAALEHLGVTATQEVAGPVIVLVMDRDRLPEYQRMATELREKGIRAEMYVGGSGMRAQMKYADRRGAPCVVIAGEDEFNAGTITVKDLIEGLAMSQHIQDNEEWRSGRPAQLTVSRSELVATVAEIISRHRT